MNSFFKSVLATIVGIFIFFAVVSVLSVMSIVGLVASSSATTQVDDNSVLVLNLNSVLEERATTNPLALISGDTESIGLDDLVNAINKAADNDKIKGIYIEGGLFVPDSWASLEEIRRSLENFKAKGKWIIAYGDQYTEHTYYLASVADKVLLNNDGEILWDGLSSEPMFLKDLLAKFGVKMQLCKVGKYKSAPEMFTADGMSEPNREQVTAYVQGTWDNVIEQIGKSRKLTKEQLNKYADDFIMTSEVSEYVKMKLVDQLVSSDEVKGIVRKQLGIDDDADVNTVSVEQMRNVKAIGNDGEQIAVYYAYGDIVDEIGSALSAGSHEIVGEEVVKDMIALADDDDVKAVVIRINSGGGSAHASEKMWQAIQKVKAKKPVVVSMGGMAASGGYYMSSPANWIVAENTTITGSIGIFGMFPDFSGLITEKLGIKFDLVKTNAHSDFGTRSRPFSADELAMLDKYIERGYDKFLSRVAEGRKMTKEQVHEIAQGRVWLGKDGKKIGLVDEIGGLDKAVAKAAQLAKLDKDGYYTESYPEEPDLLQSLLNSNTDQTIIEEQMKTMMGEFYAPFSYLKTLDRQSYIQARIPFYLNLR